MGGSVHDWERGSSPWHRSAFQPDLPFTPPASTQAEEVERLVAWLVLHPGWHTAREMSRQIGMSDRIIRRAAEHSDGLIVSGPGCPGYKHLRHTTAEELAHAADKLRSQARSMLGRSIRLRRRAHQIIR